MPMVTLIAMTMVDWEAYIQSVLNAMGRSPTRTLDTRATPINHLAAYLASLDCIKNELSDPISAIKTANATLEHLSLTFAIEATDLDFLRVVEVHGGITITTGIGVAICTASLGTWKLAILEACKKQYPKTVRAIFNEIFFILRKDELGYIFGDINIKKHQDGTHLLG
jgi:hypothetical protein